jgi:glycosyltransferase involved in cell wall biosynthesis
MKILLINKYHYIRGGAERAYFDMAEVLTEAGHEVAFFSMQHPQNASTVWSNYFVSGVEYEASESQGLWYRLRAMTRIWWNYEAQRNLDALIDDFKPDIAHLHNIYHQLSPSIVWTLKKRGIPVVMTLHDYKLICPNYSLFVRGKVWEKSKPKRYYACVSDRCVKDSFLKSMVCVIEAYLHQCIGSYSKVDAFVAPSAFLIHKFKEFGFEKEIRLLPQPILHTSTHTDDVSIALTPDAPFVFFGRLSKEKGIDVAIRAMTHYKGAAPLYIVGEGSEEESLRRLAQEIGVEQRVKFTGVKYGEELTTILKQARAIIVPSIWYENMPYVLIESFELSKVVIASRMGGITERITDGENGFLFDSGDTQALASKMSEADALSDDARHKLCAQAHASLALFTRQAYLESLESLYKELLESK